MAPTLAISANVVPSVERSILNPCSYVELSVHARLMRPEDTGVADRFDGAAGVGRVVAAATFV